MQHSIYIFKSDNINHQFQKSKILRKSLLWRISKEHMKDTGMASQDFHDV